MISVRIIIASLIGAIASAFIWGAPSIPLLAFVLIGISALGYYLQSNGPRRNWIVVDGSNVLYWDQDQPDIKTLYQVILALKSEGFVPLVWFDANAGYLVGQRYMRAAKLANLIGLPEYHVFVAPKGTPADPLLLQNAVELKARVVSNDRFRDWEEQFPQIREEGFLVRGRMRKDEFELELGE